MSKDEGNTADGGKRVKSLLLRIRALRPWRSFKASQGSSLNSL